MPTFIPGVRFAEAYASLQRFGWRFSHQTGCYVIMVNDRGGRITLPRHGSADLKPGLMGKIVTEAGINPDHFLWALYPFVRRPKRFNFPRQSECNPSFQFTAPPLPT